LSPPASGRPTYRGSCSVLVLGPPSAPAHALSASASRTTSVVRPADSKRTVGESAALRVPADGWVWLSGCSGGEVLSARLARFGERRGSLTAFPSRARAR